MTILGNLTQHSKVDYSHLLELTINIGAIDIYMEQVDDMLKNTTDPFAQKYPEIFRSVIEDVARDNWLKEGEPILTKEQMDDAYSTAKSRSEDKSWEILGRFNVCLN